MNKELLEKFRSQYKTENSVLKRIEFCKSHIYKNHANPPYEEQLPVLYALLGEIRVKNSRILRSKIAYKQSLEKNNRKGHQRKINSLYESSLNALIEKYMLDICPCDAEVKRKYFRFFFPFKKMSKKGILHPITGFPEDVALMFIDSFIKADIMYPMNECYEIFCKNRVTGKEFIKMYCNGIDSYKKLFPKALPQLLSKLYNIRQGSSAAVGNGEYLLRLKISDINKKKDGDLCTDSGMNLEMKSAGGRLSCQIETSTDLMDSILYEECAALRGYTMKGYGMINAYKKLKSMGMDDKYIIEVFAKCKIKTYCKYLSQEQNDLFVMNMTDNWDGFFFNGEFTEKSVDWINMCHDAYVYPLLEKFNYLKIDSKQPKDRGVFNVHFSIFHRDDFCTPGVILSMLENKQIIPSGVIKNNGRDNSMKVDIVDIE